MVKNPAWGGLFAASGEGIQLRHGPHKQAAGAGAGDARVTTQSLRPGDRRGNVTSTVPRD